MASPTQWIWVWIPGVGDGQGGLACCGSWGHKESDATELKEEEKEGEERTTEDKMAGWHH